MVTGKRKVGVAKGERRETPATIALGRVHRNGPVCLDCEEVVGRNGIARWREKRACLSRHEKLT